MSALSDGANRGQTTDSANSAECLSVPVLHGCQETMKDGVYADTA